MKMKIFTLTLLLFSLQKGLAANYQQGGCAWRKALMGTINVYQICMHSGKGVPQNWKNAFTDKPTYEFQLSLDFHYNAGGEKSAQAFKEALMNHPALDAQDSQARKSFVEWMNLQDIKKGSLVALTFNQKETGYPALIIHKVDGKTLEYPIENRHTARALAKVYLGDPPFREDIKTALLGKVEIPGPKN